VLSLALAVLQWRPGDGGRWPLVAFHACADMFAFMQLYVGHL
jgi:hypothetical protein